MIRYALRCRDGHAFEAWFSDSAAYDAQRAAGYVACAVCGGADVEKALMAPAVPARTAADAPGRAVADARVAARDAPERHAPERQLPALSGPVPAPVAQALAALRAHVERTADYVGPRFAEEARLRHLQGDEARPVWGEASPAEARALLEEGVPVAPLPLLPRRDD